MIEENVTTPPGEDVAVDVEEPGQEVDNIDQVDDGQETDTEETTEDTDYDSAWDNIDINNPSDDLFSKTTDLEGSDNGLEDQQEVETKPEVDQVETTGLTIKNPTLKYKGRDIPVDSEEEAINLMQKGFKLENEMSKIKPYKSYIAMIEASNITEEDMKAFGDAMSGDKGAIEYLVEKIGYEPEVTKDDEVDRFYDDEPKAKPEKKKNDYKPEVKPQDEVAEFFHEYTAEKPEEAGKVSQVYSDIDDEFKREVYNPQTFPMFVKSIETGEFDEVYPLAIKARVSNPALSWLQAYAVAGQRLKEGTKQPETEVPPKSTSIPKNGSSKRRTSGDSYDRAFEMDTKELEDRLFS